MGVSVLRRSLARDSWCFLLGPSADQEAGELAAAVREDGAFGGLPAAGTGPSWASQRRSGSFALIAEVMEGDACRQGCHGQRGDHTWERHKHRARVGREGEGLQQPMLKAGQVSEANSLLPTACKGGLVTVHVTSPHKHNLRRKNPRHAPKMWVYTKNTPLKGTCRYLDGRPSRRVL